MTLIFHQEQSGRDGKINHRVLTVFPSFSKKMMLLFLFFKDDIVLRVDKVVADNIKPCPSLQHGLPLHCVLVKLLQTILNPALRYNMANHCIACW